MAELSTVARPYAVALFEATKTAGVSGLNAVSGELAQALSLSQAPEVAALVNSPAVNAKALTELFTAASKNTLSAPVQNFLAALFENKRASVLPDVVAQFQKLKNNFESASDAVITSAFELSAAQANEIAAALSKKFGKTLKPIVTIDPSLIGGVRVAVGDEVLDSSVRTQLEKMRAALIA